MASRRLVSWWLLVPFALIAGIWVVADTSLGDNDDPEQRGSFGQALYYSLPEHEVIAEADHIAVGTIADVSSPRWNSDDGAKWSASLNKEARGGAPSQPPAAFMYYNVVIDVEEYWRHALSASDTITLTFVGTRPGEQSADAARVIEAGNKIVVFARQTELGWRENWRKSALLASGAYQGVYLVRGDGSLLCADGGEDGGMERSKYIQDLREAVAASP